MRVAIAGGNGFIGRALTERLRSSGHEVVWLSHTLGRDYGLPEPQRPDRECPLRPDDQEGAWVAEIAIADAVVNLSGYPISSRWNPRTKMLMTSSRIDLTRSIVEAMVGARERARAAGTAPAAATLVNASAVGIYGDSGEMLLTEESRPGNDWLARLAVAWEAEALRAKEDGIRVVTPRTGIVLGDEGFLPRMKLPMRMFAGGPVGSGEQWMSWIHITDMARIYAYAVENHALTGPVNAAAPQPLRMKEFARAMGAVMHRPSWIRVPEMGLRLVLGEFAPYAVMSQRMSVDSLLNSGFEFAYPVADAALRDLLAS